MLTTIRESGLTQDDVSGVSAQIAGCKVLCRATVLAAHRQDPWVGSVCSPNLSPEPLLTCPYVRREASDGHRGITLAQASNDLPVGRLAPAGFMHRRAKGHS